MGWHGELWEDTPLGVVMKCCVRSSCKVYATPKILLKGKWALFQLPSFFRVLDRVKELMSMYGSHTVYLEYAAGFMIGLNLCISSSSNPTECIESQSLTSPFQNLSNLWANKSERDRAKRKRDWAKETQVINLSNGMSPQHSHHDIQREIQINSNFECIKSKRRLKSNYGRSF